MHEYSIVQALLTEVEAQATRRGASAIHRLHVRIGRLSGVEVELLETAYETFREGTLCASAPLSVVTVPARWVCSRCEETIATGSLLRCAACGGAARLASGDEIILDRIEMEVANV